MKRAFFAPLIVLMSLFLFACGSGDSWPRVNYTPVQAYFVRNTYEGVTNPSYLIIRNYSSFDALFHMLPGHSDPVPVTEESISTRFVVTIIYQGNDIRTLTIRNIQLHDGELVVSYTSDITEPNAAYTCNCYAAALVDNSDFTSVRFVENGKTVSNVSLQEL
jgi:hypothetical protein